MAVKVNEETKGAEVSEYKVLSNLKHNGRDYRKGHTVKLTAKQAKHAGSAVEAAK